MNPQPPPTVPGSSRGAARAAQELQRRGRLAEAEQRLRDLAERRPVGAPRAGAARRRDIAPRTRLLPFLDASLAPASGLPRFWCRREARDIGLSIFSENFALDSRFATDLGDFGLTIIAQHRLTRHWQATLTDALALPADLDGVSRAERA